MAPFILAGLLLGVVLIPFNVFALIPVMCLGMILVMTGGMVRGDGVLHVLATMAVFWVTVQVGYVAAIISAFAVHTQRRPNWLPTDAGISTSLEGPPRADRFSRRVRM